MRFFPTHDHSDDVVATLLLLAGGFLGLIALTLFAGTLSYQVKVAPVILQNIVPWQYANVRPEPWEPELYHLGALLIPLFSVGTWLTLKKIFAGMPQNQAMQRAIFFAVGSAILWLGIFFGGHMNSLEQFSTGWMPQPWQSLFFFRPSLLVAAVLSAGIFWGMRFLPKNEARWMTVSEVVIVTIGVLVLTCDVHMLRPIQEQFASDDHWFMIPAADILQGKHLLVDSSSQYGFLLFYALAGFFKLFGISLASFKAFTMLVHVCYYLLLYVLLRVFFKKRSHALAAFVFVLGWTMLRHQTRGELYGEPSVTRLRNFFDVPVLLLYVLEVRTKKTYMFALTCILSAFAFFYNVDIGIGLGLTTAVWAVLLPLNSLEGSAMSIVKTITLRLATLIGCIVGLGIVISLIMKGVTGNFPMWSEYFFFGKLYSAGFGAMPMPAFGAYWGVLGVYAIAIVTGMYLWLTKRGTPTNALLLSIAGYGLLVFHYYLNRSFIANLWVIALPAALCACVLFEQFWNAQKEGNMLPLRSVMMGIAGLLWLTNFASFLEGSTDVLQRRFTATPLKYDTTFDAQMKQSVEAIHTLTTPEEGVGLLALNEPIFLLAADRKSAFGAPMLQTVFTVDGLVKILNTFAEKRRPYLFVEHESGRCAMCQAVMEGFVPLYEFDHTAGLLDVYKRKPN